MKLNAKADARLDFIRKKTQICNEHLGLFNKIGILVVDKSILTY